MNAVGVDSITSSQALDLRRMHPRIQPPKVPTLLPPVPVRLEGTEARALGCTERGVALTQGPPGTGGD